MSSLPRKPHIMKGEKTLTIPRHFIFFDTETNQIPISDEETLQTFKLGWACYYRRPYGRHIERIEWQYFDDIEVFWSFVFSHTEKKQKLWVIARNIVFDFTICKGWDFLKREKYKLKFFYNGGISAIVSVAKPGSAIVFLDSMNWFTESLAKTGERIGVPKMDIDFETCTWSELKAYCKHDVFIELTNFQHFIDFMVDHEVSRICYTKASTAMAAYLYKHYHTNIYIHNNAEAVKLERESYKGGRCECFRIGTYRGRDFFGVDVNSLYPSVMRGNLYPVKYKYISHNRDLDKFKDIIESHSVIARVMINTDEPVYAIKRDRTIFPTGTFITSLCTPELKYAIEHGHITEVYDYVVYEQAEIFTSYVDEMYRIRNVYRDKDNKQFEQLAKYLLNSLYGKFGQKGEDWVKIGEAPDEPDREEIVFRTNPRLVTKMRYLLGEVFELKGYSECFDSFPGIAAHVTAYGRMHLWSLIKIAARRNCFYCDTDSLIVNTKGLDNLKPYLDETKLGYLKLEKSGNVLELRGLKDYSFAGETKRKGIRKDADLTKDGGYRQEMWSSFKGLLKSGDAGRYVVKNVIKHLTGDYTKGTVTKNGIVKPFTLNEKGDT